MTSIETCNEYGKLEISFLINFASLFPLKAGLTRIFIFRYMIAGNHDLIVNYGE